MLLSVHAITGVLIGERIAIPWIAFALALLSHYFLDMIPHGDFKRPAWLNNFVYLLLAGFLDIIILCLFLFYFDIKNLLNFTVQIAIIGSLLPDLHFIFFRFKHLKYLQKYFKFHEKFHNAICKKFDLKFNFGLVLQLLIFITLFKIII